MIHENWTAGEERATAESQKGRGNATTTIRVPRGEGWCAESAQEEEKASDYNPHYQKFSHSSKRSELATRTNFGK
jgi:hypothetical protein